MENGIIFGNKVLDIVFISMFIAQLIKVLAPLLKLKKPDISRIFETGGMPSSHTSSVVSLVYCIGHIYGISSPIFALTLVFAIIVMYDATGIRREAGAHARALNKIIFNSSESLEEIKAFKEFLGHTPLEVLCGILLGLIVPIIFRGYLV